MRWWRACARNSSSPHPKRGEEPAATADAPASTWSRAYGVGSSAQRAQAVNGGGQGEIEHRQAARVVRGEDQAHLVPADVDVGMVVGGLGGGADLVDEGQRRGEVAQRHGGGELVVLALPGDPLFGQRCVDVGRREHRFAHGWVISSGRTAASNCSAVRYPRARAASRNVVPSLWAFLATSADLS